MMLVMCICANVFHAKVVKSGGEWISSIDMENMTLDRSCSALDVCPMDCFWGACAWELHAG